MKLGDAGKMLENMVIWNNQYRPPKEDHLSALLLSTPGAGKSHMVIQVAARLDADIIISHPVISDPTDYKGFPHLYKEMQKEGGEGKITMAADFIPFGELRKLQNAIRPTIWFIDDVGHATVAVQASLMQPWWGREINGIRMSDFVTIFAASNRRNDGAGVQGLLETIKNRTVLINVEPDPEEFCRWGIKHGIPSKVIGWVRFCGSQGKSPVLGFKVTGDMTTSPTPRSIAMAGKLLVMAEKAKPEIKYEILQESVAGCIGDKAASDMFAYFKFYDSIPDIEMVKTQPVKADLPKNNQALYALISILPNHTDNKTFGNIIKYLARLPKGEGDFQTMYIKDAIVKNPTLATSKEYIDWANKNPLEVQ